MSSDPFVKAIVVISPKRGGVAHNGAWWDPKVLKEHLAHDNSNPSWNRGPTGRRNG